MKILCKESKKDIDVIMKKLLFLFGKKKKRKKDSREFKGWAVSRGCLGGFTMIQNKRKRGLDVAHGRGTREADAVWTQGANAGCGSRGCGRTATSSK